MSDQQLAKDLLDAVRTVAVMHELHIEKDGSAVSTLVRELGRIALTLARAADHKVTGVLVHITERNLILVSVRHEASEWLVVGDSNDRDN